MLYLLDLLQAVSKAISFRYTTDAIRYGGNIDPPMWCAGFVVFKLVFTSSVFVPCYHQATFNPITSVQGIRTHQCALRMLALVHVTTNDVIFKLRRPRRSKVTNTLKPSKCNIHSCVF